MAIHYYYSNNKTDTTGKIIITGKITLLLSNFKFIPHSMLMKKYWPHFLVTITTSFVSVPFYIVACMTNS